MARLTKYQNFEALKLDSNSDKISPEETRKWHLQMEDFLTVLRKELLRKQASNEKNQEKI